MVPLFNHCSSQNLKVINDLSVTPSLYLSPGHKGSTSRTQASSVSSCSSPLPLSLTAGPQVASDPTLVLLQSRLHPAAGVTFNKWDLDPSTLLFYTFLQSLPALRIKDKT